MRLATLRIGAGAAGATGGRGPELAAPPGRAEPRAATDSRAATVAARIEGDHAVILEPFADVAAVLRAALAADGGLAAVAGADGPVIALDGARFAPVVVAPGKIFCMGMNYRSHIKEMGRAVPAHPSLFAKWKESLIGAGEAIQLPPESSQVDWEGELAVIIGRRLRRVDAIEAAKGIAGYTLMCDTSMRDWQYRTSQWMQGKAWENSTPLGPWMATTDELAPGAELITTVDGREVQRGRIADLLVPPAAVVSYISTFISLEPGDVIATGTPGGVGHARCPPAYLKPGQEVAVTVTGLGTLRSKVEIEVISGP
ncbi:MAG: fumarylacetoacetate hydrolase family protein [Bifidobacteriaceae bacterium]|jgi:acylpyruvate hydrolase|nr:fumarylacetoacetate hydrolase family protein [Bifidobacteriaceae bacterium]